MPKTVKTPNPMGENYVLTITVPRSVHEPKYASVLQKTALRVTVPGFRKGKAPTRLVEDQIGQAGILDAVLEEVLPELYAKAVEQAGVTPLVPPQIKIVSIKPKEDWVVEAHTATAPEVHLGDWKKVVKKAGEKHKKENADHKPHEGHDPEQELLSAILAALIEETHPAIPPLLLEQEARRQIEEFARTLASHRLELDQFLQSTGKTVESLQQEYMVSSLANLQVEFTISAITDELKVPVSEAEVLEVLGKKLSEYPKESQDRIHAQAQAVVARKKTLKILTDTAKAE